MGKFIDKMKGQQYIDNTRAYLDYIENHLENVCRAFHEITDACKHMAWVSDDYTWHTVRIDVERHDISKFCRQEFTQYRDYFYPTLPHDKENSAFQEACAHHIASNRHHHESATTFIDIIHMVIDWTAMGYVHGDTAQEYYEKNQEKINLTKSHKDFMLEIFRNIKEYNDRIKSEVTPK